MALTIVGEHNFPGRMLVTAMIKAQAAAKGGPAMKQAAGAGMLDKYLAAHSAGLSMPAGEAINKLTGAEERRDLLAQVVEPFFSTQETLFGTPFRDGRKPNRIEAGVLAGLLQTELPSPELTMDGLIFKKAAHNLITNGQYAIFIAQTGHRTPTFWDDPSLGQQRPDLAVVGVNYYDDASAFAEWLGRKIPTDQILAALSREKSIYFAQVEWELSSTERDGESIIYSLNHGKVHVADPASRRWNTLGFRVMG
jgi:hypothetical protein